MGTFSSLPHRRVGNTKIRLISQADFSIPNTDGRSGTVVDRVLPISCFIIAKNEADRIARTIRSVRSWVDEVIVVDSESADDTVAVARQEGARVVTQPWLGFGGQKRFGEAQCRNDWVFNIDADEVVTRQLQIEITKLFEKDFRPLSPTACRST